MTVCGEAGDADEGLAAVRKLDPDVAVIDVAMPGRDGIRLAKDLSSRCPDCRILMLSIHEETDIVEGAIRAGARGYVVKSDAPRLIVSAIRKVNTGEVFIPAKMASDLLVSLMDRCEHCREEDDPAACLSDREREILEMTGRGMGTRQIAEKLHRSVNTIETHKRNIKQKLNIGSAAELASFAAEWLSSL
jgi:DNA-binding NarL/FixJ family response regulator